MTLKSVTHLKLSLWTMYNLTNMSEFKERGPQLKIVTKAEGTKGKHSSATKVYQLQFRI